MKRQLMSYTLRNNNCATFVLLIIAHIACVENLFSQSVYYVSSFGNDSNNGVSASTPFKSIDRVNKLLLKPGDRVLFKKGDIFRGGLTLFQSGTIQQPIVIDSYGQGSAPIISGSVPINNWSNVGNNIWQASCSQCGADVTGVYDDNIALPLGRFPNLNSQNKGYLTVESHVSKTQLTSKEPLVSNWTNAEIVVRSLQWILDKAIVVSQEGSKLNLSSALNYDISDGWGYFIQKHPLTLDTNGEWYYDPASKVIKLYYDAGNPNARSITVAVIGEGFTTYNQSNISIRNINIDQTSNIGFYAATTSNMTVRNVTVSNCGTDGIQINGRGDGLLFDSCIVENVNNNGVQIQQYTNLTFKNSRIRKIGLVPGRGRGGDGQYIAFNSYGESNILIDGNILDSLGYHGIVFPSSNHTIQRNTISNFCITKSDGAGIYTWNGNKLQMSNIKILNNIIYKAMGAPEGSIYTTYSGANGIYLDDCSQNVEIRKNTVFDCYGMGIFLHATTKISVDSNTSYNNREGQFVLAHNNNYCSTRENKLYGNIFLSKNAQQSVVRFESVNDDLKSYGTFNNNYYARPFDDDIKVGAGYMDAKYGTIINGDILLSEWQNQFEKDVNSKGSSIRYKDYVVESVNSGFKIKSTFDENTNGWYPYSYYGNGRAIWSSNGFLINSLQIDFAPALDRKASYVFVYNGIGKIEHDRGYILKFDAVSSAENKSVQVFLRQRNGTYTDLTSRYSAVVGTSIKSYEFGFVNPIAEDDAIVMIKVLEDGKTLWLDNITLQEADLSPVNGDRYIKIAYNPTYKDSTFSIIGGYRDVMNNQYVDKVKVRPYESVILLRNAPTTTDLSLSIITNKRFINVGEEALARLIVRNSVYNSQPISLIEWESRLPPNIEITDAGGATLQSGVLKGTVRNLEGLTSISPSFKFKVLSPGRYRITTQITSASVFDLDSDPNSGTADGEDDTDMFEVHTSENRTTIFNSPNPNQVNIPNAIYNYFVPERTDLSLISSSNKIRTVVGDTVTLRVTVKNGGKQRTSNVTVLNVIPKELRFYKGVGWTNSSINGQITNTISAISGGESVDLYFMAVVIQSGVFQNRSQIFFQQSEDYDSIPGNGYSNGEDDETQITIRAF